MRVKKIAPVRFSEHFKLPTNIDFGFLDIYANQVTAPTRVIINVQCEHHIDVGDE